MRDIRPDLRERLEQVIAEARRLQRRIEMLQLQESHLKALLEEEETRWGVQQSLLDMSDIRGIPKGRTVLSQFLLDTLSDGQIWTVERLKSLAAERGIRIESKHPGRSLHFALVGLKQAGWVDMPESGHWRLKASKNGSDGEAE